MHPSIMKMLAKQGHEVTYSPKITRAEILESVAKFEGLIIRSKTPMDRELLEKATNLKFIGRAGAGLDQIDLDFLVERGVKLFHAAPPFPSLMAVLAFTQAFIAACISSCWISP